MLGETAAREKLHSALWKVACGLRSASLNNAAFMPYVLGMLSYRFLSERLTSAINSTEGEGFDYAKLDDDVKAFEYRALDEDGYFLLPSQLFCNVLDNAHKVENLSEVLGKVFESLYESVQDDEARKRAILGIFNGMDFGNKGLGQEVSDRNALILKLMRGIAGMNLHFDDTDGIDAFGDAYEYLIYMYASSAGTKSGEFYTPQEVSELLACLTLYDRTTGESRTSVNKVYDPTCGSGSLLLRFGKKLGVKNVGGFFGQEVKSITYNLCRINMLLNDVPYSKSFISLGDTILNPSELHADGEPFQAIVSNPPYSLKYEDADDKSAYESLLTKDQYHRFSDVGVLAPVTKLDFAFILHSYHWLSEDGTASIVCFPGIFYRGNKEQKIRKWLVADKNAIDTIIQLPENLFYGTSITTCIMVMKKNKSDNSVLFIDASKEFIKVTKKNSIALDNIENILRLYKDRKDVPYKARLVSAEDIAKNDFNLSVSTYVEKEDTREKIDIKKLNAEIKRIVARENELRAAIDDIIAELEVDEEADATEVVEVEKAEVNAVE